jgi:hypothetical protein
MAHACAAMTHHDPIYINTINTAEYLLICDVEVQHLMTALTRLTRAASTSP